MSRDPNIIPVETRTEAGVRQALLLAQIIGLFMICGWACICAWNVVSCFGLRRWFRVIPYSVPSAFGGLLVGGGFSWHWSMMERHPELCCWWPVAALVTIGLLRLETIGWRENQRVARQQLAQEEADSGEEL